MPDDANSSKDRDLLSRLNALKQSTVSFNATTFNSSLSAPAPTSLDPSPGRALHTDLLSRWKSLGGATSNVADDLPQPLNDSTEDSKTIEELLADLGPSEDWEIGKSEEAQVEDLLNSAKAALAVSPHQEYGPLAAEEKNSTPTGKSAGLPAIDVTAFQPDPDSDEEVEERPPLGKTRETLDTEADELLARILDEVKHEPPERQNDDRDGAEATDLDSKLPDEQPEVDRVKSRTSALAFPTTPSKLPEPAKTASTDAGDEDLASRFAGLSLPSVPFTIASKSKTASKPSAGFTDEEIDSWCIICSDDATLQCIGCDGDLYCTNCWIEGHRGEDAGFEERKHKAVQFVKGGGKKKVSKRRTMVGA